MTQSRRVHGRMRGLTPRFCTLVRVNCIASKTKKTMSYRVFFLVAAFLVAVGCQKMPTVAAVEPDEQPAPQYHYSPFVVQVPDSGMQFRTITFKDVGTHRATPAPDDELLQAVAEAVAHNLQMTPELEVRESLVSYQEELSDPANHLACETEHLYVDVWDGSDKWGYSLWSGCSEDDNFDWKQVEIPADSVDLPSRVEPLGRAIARSLVAAHRNGCFTKSC